jgi:glycosyltransferase involved in cell wall biosynthesis
VSSLRIAQVAPLIESVPPKLYGGTEREVAILTDELVRQGHDVTLFASGDSSTSATLVAPCAEALRLSNTEDPLALHVLMVELVVQRAEDFDIVHFHIAPLHFSMSRRLRTPHVTTIHGRLDLPELAPLYAEFTDLPLVSISNAQRAPLTDLNWVGTVYNGLPADTLTFHPGPGSYLAFLGRISREKRADRAIAIAKACGWPLRIAAKVDPNDETYFKNEIEPLLEDPLVEFVGEIDEAHKSDFLGHARALLFPIDWPEPFGLVMIEALACGTPVVAFRGGSVDEVIEDGLTGFIVEDVESAVQATARTAALDRRACREAFDRRFTGARMAEDYSRLYGKLLAGVAD